MIPSVFIRVEELPMNTNGKIDRLKIREDLIK
jgi:acyl-coenzyme A synthetase/AMP-(fatty) acid ligase